MVGKKTEQRSAGYILLHRRITDHWIWKDRDTRKLKWWLDILMQCNHDLQKVSIGWEIMECKRGESLKSLGTWSKRWGVDINTVRRFMKMLEKDNMIVTKSEQKTTRLTVCNYDGYNDLKQAKDTRKKSISKEKEFPETTNNTLINTQLMQGGTPPPTDANDLPKDYRTWTKEQFLLSLAKYQQKYDRKLLLAFSSYWREPDPHGKMKFQLEKTWATGRRLVNWKRIEDEKKNGTTPNYKNPSPVSPVVTDEILKNRELLNSISEQ